MTTSTNDRGSPSNGAVIDLSAHANRDEQPAEDRIRARVRDYARSIGLTRPAPLIVTDVHREKPRNG